MRVDRIWEFLQRLSPLTRSCLLTELERLELCGIDMPGSADLQARLRAELRPDGAADGPPTPSKYFFAPLEPLLVDSAPDHANPGRIARSSLVPIWEWICRDLLQVMARDYNEQMKALIASNKPKDIQQSAAIFQVKVAKSLEGNLASPAGAERARARLAAYTASPSVYGDLVKMMGALRARDALAKFGAALPKDILKFDDAKVGKITKLLDAFRKKDPAAVPFALALVAGRLKAPRELVRLATKAARSRSAADVAATPYAIAISMVLDQIDDKRIALRVSLKKNRVVDARDKRRPTAGQTSRAAQCLRDHQRLYNAALEERREAREELGAVLLPNDLHLTGLVSEHGYQGQSHWLMFLFEVKPRLNRLPRAHREGRFQFFAREQIEALKLPQTDLEKIWPWFWQHRGGFFAAHCHCRQDGKHEWSLEESIEEHGPRKEGEK